MCGIFGLTLTKNSELKKHFSDIAKELFLLSESRGKEASGFVLNNGSALRFLKTPFPASDLINSKVFANELSSFLGNSLTHFTLTGHSRLVTNGYEQNNDNNQPVIKNKMATVHNGIITNSSELWSKYNDEEKLTDLDSELIPTLLDRFYNKSGNLKKSVAEFYKEIYGMTSVAIQFVEFSNLLLATNNGSLYFVRGNDNQSFLFASEKYILKTLIENLSLEQKVSISNISHLEANHTCFVNLENTSSEISDLQNTDSDFSYLNRNDKNFELIEIKEKVSNKPVHVNTSMEYKTQTVPKKFEQEIEKRTFQISTLVRCTKCILPETFPYIEFDKAGVCNYCNHYQQLKFKGADKFKDLLETFRSKNDNPDCLMPFSGGRDSSYALHYVKKELGMKPIAFSYDWGMLTDLARRNQARMCGKLGIEHILVSADIRKKRENIHKNVSAWLKRPSLGTIPLFMAGDKQYFYFANLLMEQNNLNVSIMGENMLETTRFKSGFCGIKPNFNSEHTYTLSTSDKLKMIFYYGKEYLLNPSYINGSLLDTLDAFKSYYMIKHQNVNLFDYIPWEEEKVEKVLIEEYDWETDPGTKTTWRIGDGTAAFYNYIYYVVAGFSENDTFRSNQIREGVISRDFALQRTSTENFPRWDSIQWYCNTINIDFEKTVSVINKIKTLYPVL